MDNWEKVASRLKALEDEIERLKTGEGKGVWADWTPNLTQYTTMTFTSTTIETARYLIHGKLCFIKFQAYGTLGGTAAPQIDFSPPLSSNDPDGLGELMIATWAQPYNGSAITGKMIANSTNTVFRVYKVDGTNFTTGTTVRIHVSGFYEAA